ncbi:hypothetical protein ABEF92_002148 [Exophiala dermatitidis]
MFLLSHIAPGDAITVIAGAEKDLKSHGALYSQATKLGYSINNVKVSMAGRGAGSPRRGAFLCALCRRDFMARKTVFRHYRDQHPAQAGTLTRHESWVVAADAAGAGQGSAASAAFSSMSGGPNDGNAAAADDNNNNTTAAAATSISTTTTTTTNNTNTNTAAAPTPTDTNDDNDGDYDMDTEDNNNEVAHDADAAGYPPWLDPRLWGPLTNPADSPAPGLPSPDPQSTSQTSFLTGRQLRSSRSTRNQDHNAAARNRAGGLDLDPTDGLPVQKFELRTVRVSQEGSSDHNDGANQPGQQSGSDIWREPPLPSFFNQLPQHSQALLRRARMGNTNVTPSEWDRKTNSWIPGSEVEARNSRLKLKHLSTVPDSPNSHDEDDNADDNDDLLDADGLPPKRRRQTAGLQERYLEVKKWVPIDPARAEKLPEPKYLADRRPGMQSLYGGAYKATNGFGTLGANPLASSDTVSYDLGEGAGLGNASGVLGSTSNAPPAPTPVRRNMPPKRKKKKLGGPGRRKANPIPLGENTPATVPQDATMTGTGTGTGTSVGDSTPAATQDGQAETNPDGDAEGPGSESEGEGSEEGEIEENTPAQTQTQIKPDDGAATQPPVDSSADTAQSQLQPQPQTATTANDQAQSEVTAPTPQETGTHQTTSAESLHDVSSSSTLTARQQAAQVDEAVSDPAPQTQKQPEPTSEIPDTDMDMAIQNSPHPIAPPEQQHAIATSDDTEAALPNVEPEAEPELVLEQLDRPSIISSDPPILQATPVITSTTEPEPTSETVTTEDAVAPNFEHPEEEAQTTAHEPEQKSLGDETLNQDQDPVKVVAETTNVDMVTASAPHAAAGNDNMTQQQPEQGETLGETQTQPQTEPPQLPLQSSGDHQGEEAEQAPHQLQPEQAQIQTQEAGSGEVDLLGGLEAAVEKEHRAL